MASLTRGLFITGTDTGVGKTYVASAIARQLLAAAWRVGVYKPAASGCRVLEGQLVSDDALSLWNAAGRPASLDRVAPQCFAAPLAPHLAARAEGRAIDSALLRQGVRFWQETSDIVLVEGAGGLLSPLGKRDCVADLAADIGYPLLIVARNALGTINHTLLTLAVARQYSLAVAGVVLNQASPGTDDLSIATNGKELAARIDVPLVASVAFNSPLAAGEVDWYSLARPITKTSG